MHKSWYNFLVVLLWLAAMSWLIVAKVLPSLLIGDPPSYRTIIDAKRQEPPVGWHIALNQRPIGWAISKALPLADNLTEIHSRVYFPDLPLDELTPGWVGAVVRMVQSPGMRLPLDARSIVRIDALGRLLGFDSSLWSPASTRLVVISGRVEGSQLALSVEGGGLKYETELRLPADAILTDVLSPQTQLPDLRTGQKWRVPSCNPLRPGQPLEVLTATVEGKEPFTWNGKTEDVWVVVYRPDFGFAAPGNSRALRGRLWVRPNGTVLQQQLLVLDATMSFLRMSDTDAAALAAQLGEKLGTDKRQ
jgi:hypothetical protein